MTGDSIAATTVHGPVPMAARARSTARAISAGSDGGSASASSNIGFTERDEVGARRDVDALELGDGAGEGEIGEVEGHDVDRVGYQGHVEVAEIGALEHHHSGVLTQAAPELPVPDVDGVDPRGARSQQRQR